MADAPGIEQVLWELASVCRGRHLAAYNFDYDRRLLEQSAGAINRPDLFRAFQVAATGAGCIMRIYAQYRGEINATYGDFRWHRLDVAARTVCNQSRWSAAPGINGRADREGSIEADG